MVELEVIKVQGSCNWAVKATINSESRYRGFYYKSYAVKDIKEWERIKNLKHSHGKFIRDYHHNFHTAKELFIILPSQNKQEG